MNRRLIFGILLALALLAGAAAIGSIAYNAGVARGLVESGRLVPPGEPGITPGERIAPYPYFFGGPFFHPRPFGFGFGLLGCLFPLLFFFLIFGLLRGLFFWRGPWRWGHAHGPWTEKGVPPAFEEWPAGSRLP